MKKLLVIISFFCFPFRLLSCPLCVGKVRSDSPLFFSDELYQPGKAEQSIVKEQQAHEQLKKLLETKKEKK
jgi:hypothetical protein